MMMKKVYATENEIPERIESQRWQQDNLHHPSNLPPQGFREITEAEFAQSAYFTYGSAYSESRQVYVPGEPYCLSINIFWLFSGEGFAMHADYWGKKIRYFRCGCDHQWKPIQAQYYPAARNKCEVCGIEVEHDTSD